MKRIYWRRACLILLSVLLVYLKVWAASDNGGKVTSVDELISALGSSNVTKIDDRTVRINDNVAEISLSNTLVISGGDMVLDLNGKKISLEVSNKKAICIQVTGGTLVITGGGTVFAKTTYTLFGSKNDAIALSYTGGILQVYNGIFSAIPAKGKKAYTLDPDIDTVNEMLPYGTYIVGGNSSNYESDGLEASSTTVALSTYTAVYDFNSGTKLSDGTTSYTLEDQFTYPTASRSGYEFKLWKSDDGIEMVNNIPVLKNRAASGTIHFTADWAPIQYAIQYEMNGGTNDATNIQTYDITQCSVQLKNPMREGYDFVGWFDDKGNAITSITFDQVKNLDDKIYKIKAHWRAKKYRVDFDVLTTQGKQLIYTVEDKDISLPDPDASVVPSGQQFYYWRTSDGTKITSLPIAHPSDLTLYAVWGDIIYHAYFYDENGIQLSDFTKKYISKDGLPSAQIPPYSKKGTIFEGWFKKGDPQHAIASIPAGTAENMELYAHVTPIQYTLTYQLNGGFYSGNNPVTYTFSKKAVLPTDQDVDYPGYAFKGWFLTRDFSEGSALTEVPVSGGQQSEGGRKESFIAYAKWEKINYTIVFKTDGGTPVDNASYNITDGVPAGKMPQTTKEGYEFLGWYQGNTRVTKIEPGIGNLELTAKWELIPYKITYHLDGGTNPPTAPASYTYEQTVLLPRPEKDYYTFANWYADAGFTEGPVSEIPNHSTGDKVFYAQWTPNEYTISFETNGGSAIADQKYIYGRETEFARKTKKQHYTFAGWFLDQKLTEHFGDKISATTNGNFTLYAKWIPTVYRIEYDCYYGTNPSNAPVSYTLNDEVPLPTPVRDNFTFAGWYDNDLLTGEKQTKIVKGSSGDKKFYATWTRANTVLFMQPGEGKITVSQGSKTLKSGDRVGAGLPVTVTATPSGTGYTLQNLVINGTSYSSSPQTLFMPSADGLVISATFKESTGAGVAPAPRISLTPSNVDKFPKGESVKVRLEKTDAATTLYYTLDDSPEKAYTGEFLVESAQDTVVLRAIARKEGYKDGISTRNIIFDNGKIALTFDLPLGVKATNPEGGDVVAATTTGGSFEFKLSVDEKYYEALDSMVVAANDSVIHANGSGLYTLTNCSSDILVTVSGLKAKEFTVTLQQTDNGKISFVDEPEETALTAHYGSTVSIAAEADEDFKFLQWSTGSQNNPLVLTVSGDTTISARFISDYKAYAITLPDIEGVKVKPYSGYSTEVKKDGTFKFYLQVLPGYQEENVVVRANGEVLAKNKGGYALYHVMNNISISVEGIVRERMTFTTPDHVQAKIVETMKEASGQSLYEETPVLLHAKAPEGQLFTKWNDGKTDNPRIASAIDALQLFPLFTSSPSEDQVKVTLNQSPGAAITAVNANADAVEKGDLQLKVVLLPAYSRSDVVLTVGDQTLKPATTLRAASDTRTYFYTVPVLKEGIEVNISGLKVNTYEVTVLPAVGGTVSVTPRGKVAHGDQIQLKAEAASGKLFVKWGDGNTLNPYPYTVTGDIEVKAFFIGETSPVGNASLDPLSSARIAVQGGTLCLDLTEESDVSIWDYKGIALHLLRLPAGTYRYSLPAGAYLVKIGKETPEKVIIR